MIVINRYEDEAMNLIDYYKNRRNTVDAILEVNRDKEKEKDLERHKKDTYLKWYATLMLFDTVFDSELGGHPKERLGDKDLVKALNLIEKELLGLISTYNFMIDKVRNEKKPDYVVVVATYKELISERKDEITAVTHYRNSIKDKYLMSKSV